MNREIKFRAKQGKIIQHFPIKYGLTDWVYGWYHCTYDGSFNHEISNINDAKMETETFVIEEYTLCQITGMKDKNGKEIYENDFVKSVRKRIAKVEWGENGFFLTFPDCGRVAIYPNGIEVIGNSIDNPEMVIASCR